MAFLSACFTVQGNAGRSADEDLHRAGAYQVAGFAHVIGALWSTNDAYCARIAREFCIELVKHNEEEEGQRVVAEALWHAVMQFDLSQIMMFHYDRGHSFISLLLLIF